MPIDFERLDKTVYGGAKTKKLDFERLDRAAYREEEPAFTKALKRIRSVRDIGRKILKPVKAEPGEDLRYVAAMNILKGIPSFALEFATQPHGLVKMMEEEPPPVSLEQLPVIGRALRTIEEPKLLAEEPIPSAVEFLGMPLFMKHIFSMKPPPTKPALPRAMIEKAKVVAEEKPPMEVPELPKPKVPGKAELELVKAKAGKEWHPTVEEQRLLRSIGEAKTILKGKVAGSKRASIEKSLRMAEHKLELHRKAEAYDAAKRAKITDVTPEGYGPELPEAVARAKQPWEMTRDEYIPFWEKKAKINKGRGEAERLANLRVAGYSHRARVKQALSEGKPVPKEVLAEYPELKPKPTIPPELEGRAKEVIRPEEGLKAGIPLFKTKQERFAQALKRAEIEKGAEPTGGSPMITMELKPKDAQTLFQKPSHKYGSIPNELGELDPNYGMATAKAQQLLMLVERDIRRDQGTGRAELAGILRKGSKQNRKKYQSDIAEGLENPIEFTERKNIPEDVKQVIRGLKEKSNRERQEIIGIKREEIRPYFKRLAEKQYRAERGLKGKRLNEAQKGEINAQAEGLVKIEIPDEWGIKDYFRHLHLGEYALLRTVEGKSEYIGSARNWTEAVNKVAENYAENPEAGMNYKVNLRQFVDPDVVRVSRRRQYKILNDLRKELNAESTERIQAVLRGKIGAREAQRKWAGFMQRRKGLPGYSKDVEFVLNYHNNQFQRWKHLYGLKGKIQPLINQIKKEGRTLVADEIETNLKMLWGQKTKGSRMLDNWMEKVGRGRIRPFALERWTGRLRNLTTTLMLKTSARYNLLNSMQIMQTGMVVPYKNLVWAQRAVRTKAGKALLDQHGVYHIIKGTAGEITRMYTPVKVRASMVSRMLRLSPETANQAEMWLAVYKHGKDALKMTDAKAADYAFLRGMVYSQFLPLKVNYPRALRSPVVRVGPGMYRTFTIGALELASDLAKGAVKKGLPLKQRVTNIGRLSHFVGANLSLGGLRVITGPIGKIFGGGYLTLKIYNQIKEEYGEKTANLIHWGLPSLINSDWSLSVGLIDLPFAENIPEAIGEVALGPMGGTALRVGTQTLSNYGPEDNRLMRGARAALEKFGGPRQLLGLEKVLTGDYDFKAPSGKLRFKGDLKDALVQMYGSRPLKSAIQSMNFDAMAEVWGERNNAINSATRLMATLKEKRGYLSASDKREILQRTNGFNVKWPELGIVYGDIERRASGQDKLKDLGAFQRALKQKGKTFYEFFGMPSPVGAAPPGGGTVGMSLLPMFQGVGSWLKQRLSKAKGLEERERTYASITKTILPQKAQEVIHKEAGPRILKFMEEAGKKSRTQGDMNYAITKFVSTLSVREQIEADTVLHYVAIQNPNNPDESKKVWRESTELKVRGLEILDYKETRPEIIEKVVDGFKEDQATHTYYINRYLAGEINYSPTIRWHEHWTHFYDGWIAELEKRLIKAEQKGIGRTMGITP